MFITSKIHLLIIGLSILSVFNSGCSMMNVPIYPEIIYNNRQPLISVTYEYGEIEVILPLSYDGAKPENISFEVYGHGDTLNPIISILQEASNQFRTYLPQGVLDINDENNLIKVIPENSDFHPVNVKFKGIRFGKLELNERTIYSKPLIVRGRIFLNSDFTKNLADVNISIMSFDQILQTTKTDNAGLYRIAIPGENKDLESLRLVIGENLIFKPYRKNLDFSETFRGLVRSGEQIGRLSTVLAQLATYLERRHSLINKVRLAFTYPAIVTVVALLVVIFLLTYVVPQVVSVFVQTQQDLPILTQVMLTVSTLILDWGLLFFIFFILLFMIFRFSLRNKNIKIKWHNFLLNFPGYGKFERTLNSVRFTSTLAISSAAGVPILEALKSSKNTLSNSVMKLEIDIVIENVREGMSLSRALSLHRNFPPILIHMTRAGEITGSLSDMLTRASKSQEDELERRTLFIANLLEPALILCMGGFVLVIVLAVLMPIIEINQLIQ